MSRSIKSANLLSSRPRRAASIRLHSDPYWNACRAALTATSISACQKDEHEITFKGVSKSHSTISRLYTD